jgi:cell division protein FtsI (penicillin-binding protein 3)
MKVRIAVLGMLLAGSAGAVLARAWQVQVERAPHLARLAERQYLTARRLAPKRGTIYDRHGAELAVSVDVESVFADPQALARANGDPAQVATTLARVLDLPNPGSLAARLGKTDRKFVYVERHVTPRQARAVRRLDLPGVGLLGESRRFYPNRSLAAHVLGFANVDGVGLEGIERSLDEQLRGSGAAASAIQDARRRVVYSEQLLEGAASLGHDVVLSIDKPLQRVTERELALGVRTFEARAASAVVLDPGTGEILAMANVPTYNPNDPGGHPPAARRNRAVTDRFEPGSTVKPFTVAGALARGTIRPRQRIDCGDGELEVADEVIHDTGRYGRLTPAEILAVSSNIGTAKIGATLGRAGLFRTLRRFGFGETTGLPLPGETRGTLSHHRHWYEMDAATIAFGQGMSVTAVQLAMAAGALANGGRLMKPILVKRLVDARGRVVDEALPTVRRRVVPEDVARLVGEMMTSVTGPGGTGEDAAIEGYLVAGKTGTAQKADGEGEGYARDRWVSSFVGFAPASAPRIVVAVVIDEPVIASGGGTVAGPVFRRITQVALRQLGVPPAGGHPSGDDAGSASRDGEGDDRLREARFARLRSAKRSRDRLREGVVIESVPDFFGLPARSALRLARRARLVPELVGTGRVARQEPAPSEPLAPGDRITLVLEPPERPGPAPRTPVVDDSHSAVAGEGDEHGDDGPQEATR